MPDDLAQTPCPACDEPVFDGRPAVRCAKCGAFVHRACWTTAGARCTAEHCGSKRADHVAVVRLQPPGPTATEIGAEVAAKLDEFLKPALADVRLVMARREDVDRLRREVHDARNAAEAESAAARERAVEARATLLARLDELEKAVAETEQLLRAAPTPPKAEEISQASTAAVELATRNVATLRDEVLAAIAVSDRAARVEARRNLAASEACRWDTAARRRPLPWDQSGEDVVRPAPAGDSES
jgi:hypothetical protein